MSEKPILFNTEMVRAILDDRKTVTRRLPSKRVEEKWWEYDEWASDIYAGLAKDGIYMDRLYEKEFFEQHLPYLLGDILYVRETWQRNPLENDVEDWDIPENDKKYLYKADFDHKTSLDGHWHPSIHMPKEAARIWLKVKTVKAERLNDMKVDDAIKEGVDTSGIITKQGIIEYRVWNRMQELWDSTIKKKDLPLYGWDANPWVWVIEFERMRGEDDEQQKD